MRDDREWLLDIQEATERIKKYSSRGKRAFEEEVRKGSENKICLNSALPLITGMFMCGQFWENRRGEWFPKLQTGLRFYHGYRRLC